MTEEQLAICVRGLSRRCGRRWVLRAIDLNVVPGGSMVLTGANGAGKTTLLRCLAGAMRPTSGTVSWFGQSVAGRPALRAWVGMVGHQQRLYPQLTLRENLVFAARMCRLKDPVRRAETMIERVELESYADLLPDQLSHGMRQRASLARALIHEPRILLLDEPFTGLDRRAVCWLSDWLRDLRDTGMTMCCATHEEDRIRWLADEVYRLESGRLSLVERRLEARPRINKAA